MSTRSHTRRQQSDTLPSHSGARGGPGTFDGTGYQIKYAVYQTLDLIARALGAPHIPFEITMEPRKLLPTAETKWDIAVKPPEVLFESKLSPKKQEVLDWLNQIKTCATSLLEIDFRVVYSRGGGEALQSIARLQRDAAE